jgi:hypothetical protein
MSKRDLKKYLTELNKKQLEEQIIELYDKFVPVKTYYDFAFNPKEDLLLQESKLKISLEYFPQRTISGKPRRPKMRRSVAQKYIKHFIVLGVDPYIISDLMLYSIEISQTFSGERIVNQELFFKSMLKSYEQAVVFMISNGVLDEFKTRIVSISNESSRQNWFNKEEFSAIIERFEY